MNGCEKCGFNDTTGKLICLECKPGMYFDENYGSCTYCRKKAYGCEYC